MSRQDDPRHRYKRNRKSMEECEQITDEEKAAIGEFLEAIDPENLTETFVNADGETETKSTNTLRTYVFGLKRVAEVSDISLLDATANDINELMGNLRSGDVDHENVKDDGYSKSYMKPWQSALRGFYRYHDALGVDSEEIVIFTQDNTKVDERDMYTEEEVQALREAVDNARDKCMLELFLNTGQRIRAIQTLRIKDVNPQAGATGVYYLNTDKEGLKGADQNGAKRPLLGAKRPVYDWLQFHPKSDNPGAFLITPQKDHQWAESGEMLSQSTIRRTLKKLTDEAGIDKPPNPHNFRHYFVTMCKRDYDMDNETIKHLIGHGEGSQVMETTYSHLTDEDKNKDAETSMNLAEEEDKSPFTPPVCPTCGENLESNAKACGACGTVFAPNAQAAKEQIQQDVDKKREEADDIDLLKAVDKIKRIQEENPELLDELDL